MSESDILHGLNESLQWLAIVYLVVMNQISYHFQSNVNQKNIDLWVEQIKINKTFVE